MAHAANVPIWFEPVSVPKSVRASRVLNCITYISPNAHELIAMAVAIDSTHSTELANKLLLQMAAGGAMSAAKQLHLLAPFLMSVLKVSTAVNPGQLLLFLMTNRSICLALCCLPMLMSCAQLQSQMMLWQHMLTQDDCM